MRYGTPHRRRSPFELAAKFWPQYSFYDKQVEIVESVLYNKVTVVRAGNQLGKDWVAGFICLTTFLLYKEVRIVTTSVRDKHLDVLWGEIGNFIQTSKVPLTNDKGGPLIVNHRHIKKIRGLGTKKSWEDKKSYLIGAVSEKGEGMAGHHAGWTLAVIDEASGVDDKVWDQIQGWAKRILIFGNPNPTGNFFRKLCRAGDLPVEDGDGDYQPPMIVSA